MADFTNFFNLFDDYLRLNDYFFNLNYCLFPFEEFLLNYFMLDLLLFRLLYYNLNLVLVVYFFVTLNSLFLWGSRSITRYWAVNFLFLTIISEAKTCDTMVILCFDHFFFKDYRLKIALFLLFFRTRAA
jgi:hypothetical protein